ncbi:MAG TPA: hypothetical protein VIJ85_12530 [Rhizomicrobium sp.]
MLTLRNALLAALVGGLIAGTIDIGAACAIFHAPPVPVLHAIASGLIGHKAAVAGKMQTAWLGLFLQEFISVVAAGFYCLAAMRVPTLIARPLLWGLAFGFAVNLVMTFVIVPLSLAQAATFGTYAFYANLAANTVLFGPPIAYVARWFAGK